jgi:hypothetical protein
MEVVLTDKAPVSNHMFSLRGVVNVQNMDMAMH